MGLPTSPKARRRLAWVTVILGGAGALVLVAVLLPNHGGPRVKPGVPSLQSTSFTAWLPLLLGLLGLIALVVLIERGLSRRRR